MHSKRAKRAKRAMHGAKQLSLRHRIVPLTIVRDRSHARRYALTGRIFTGLLAACLVVPACSDDTDDQIDDSAGPGPNSGVSTTGPATTGTSASASETNASTSAGTGDTGDTGGTGVESNDIGNACDPSSSSGCQELCLGVGDNEGICVAQCTVGGPACPATTVCRAVPLNDGTSIDLCLPDPNCGTLTFEGECLGSTLHYCDFLEGELSFDCSEFVGDNGQAMQCAVVPGVGADCLSSDHSDGCGAETQEGRCEGNQLIYCESVASGEVTRIDCTATGDICTVVEGLADCITDGSSGCGSVPEIGRCDGSVASKCVDDEVVTLDCATVNQVCGYVDDAVGYGCVPKVTPGSQRVTGSFNFVKKLQTPQGLGPEENRPVTGALVRVFSADFSAEYGRAFTADNGSFQIDVSGDATGNLAVVVATVGDPSVHPVSVRNCPLADCDGNGEVYALLAGDPFPAGTNHDVGALTIPVDFDSGAFNIFDLMLKGAAFARANFGKTVPPHTVQWARGSTTACQTSCFSSGGGNLIYVLGTTQDTDEFDDPVLMHEYGHFLESAFSRADSPGGPHDGSPTDPRLAWGEGYGTFVGASIAGSPIYIDTFAAGASVTDISQISPQFDANPVSAKGMNQLLSEFMVSETLWQLSTGSPSGIGGAGTLPIFDVLGQYFTSQSLADRGVSGVDLVDFLDGWYCRGHGRDELIRAVVTGEHHFPYDFAGPGPCR